MVDLGALMRASASLLDWDMQRVGVKLVLGLPPAPEAAVRVRGDPVMLQQVLVNLLRNALDALRDDPPAEPRIALTLHCPSERAGEAEVRITDNGGAITMGPMEVPDGSWVVNAQDPQGAHFALLAAKK